MIRKMIKIYIKNNLQEILIDTLDIEMTAYNGFEWIEIITILLSL